MTDRTRARALARESNAAGDAVGWFERLYAEAERGDALVPWADLAPNPHVVEWLERAAPTPGRALDVGCGLGDTAEELARRGHDVLAIDVSPTAVAAARARFPQSRVDYRALDLRALPSALAGAFDLVVECYTLQVLPADVVLHPGENVQFWYNGARGREPGEPEGQMPWPLTRTEIEAIADAGFVRESFEDFLDDEKPPVRRFRATFRRQT